MTKAEQAAPGLLDGWQFWGPIVSLFLVVALCLVLGLAVRGLIRSSPAGRRFLEWLGL